MVNLINKVISKIKGEKFVIDSRIPASYILSTVFTQLISLIWGMLRLRIMKTVFIHPTSTVRCPSLIKCGKNLRIGRDCYVDALSTNGLICGDNVSMGFHTHLEISGSLKYLGRGIIIGNNVGLGTHGHYGGAGGVEIGDDTIFGNYISVHPENHNYGDMNTPIRLQGVNHKGIKIGKGCWIGAKVTILDGADIGDGCIVAAGAVVTGKFPPNSIIGGIPAKILKSRQE